MLPAAHPALADGGATYYVATGGDDGNPCTAAAPCASLLRATQHTAPGDTVLVQAGTYGPQTISAVGAPGRPVTVAAQGLVTLTRPLPLTTSSQSAALLRILDSAYVTIQGFSVLGAKTQTGYDANTQPYGGEVEVENHAVLPGAGITLQGLTVSHANNTCIKLQDHEPDAAIISNTVSDCGSPVPAQAPLDQGIYTSGPHTLVAGNTVSRATGYGIQAWPTGGGDVGGITIRDNTVHDNAQYGVVTGGSPVTITENLAYSNQQGGIDVVDYAHTPTTTLPDVIAGNVLANNGDAQNPGTAQIALGNRTSAGTLVASNTFYGGARFAVASVEGMGGQYTAALRVENNIFYGDPQAYGAPNTGLFNDPLPAGSAVDYNLYYNVKPYANTNEPPSYDGGHSQVQVDPRFVNAAASPLPNLQLQSTSPALGAGTTVTLPDGTILPLDLGARWCGATFCGASATATAVPTNSPTATSTPTFTPTSSPTATPTRTATRIPPTPTNAATATPRATSTPSPSPTRAVTATPAPPTATATATGTATPLPTSTATSTPTLVPPTPTAAATGTALPTPTRIATATATPLSPTSTSTPTPTNTPTATATATNTPTATSTNTATPAATSTPVPPTATSTPTVAWAATAAPRPIATSTPGPANTATATLIPAPATPTWTAASGPTPRPTDTAVAPLATPASRPAPPRHTPRPGPTMRPVSTRTPRPRYRVVARRHPTPRPTPRGRLSTNRAASRAATTRPIVTVALPRDHVVVPGLLAMHVRARPHVRIAITVAITRLAKASGPGVKRVSSRRAQAGRVAVLYRARLNVRTDGRGRATSRVRVICHTSTAVQGQLLVTMRGPLGSFTYRTGITIQTPGGQRHRTAIQH